MVTAVTEPHVALRPVVTFGVCTGIGVNYGEVSPTVSGGRHTGVAINIDEM